MSVSGPLRVALVGTWDPAFARNRTLIRLLDRAGHDVMRAQVDLWGERGDAIVRSRKRRVALRALWAYPVVVWRFLRLPRPDVVIVPYPGHLDVPLFKTLCRIRRIPLVFDVFISLHDTIVMDRKLRSDRSLLGRAVRRVDRIALRAADLVVADTPPHAEFFTRIGDLDPGRVRVVWLGAQEHVFRPLPDVEPRDDLAVFHGTFIHLQGLDTIVRAAKLLEPDGIRVRIVGDGQERTTVDTAARELEPTNLERTGLVPLDEVPRHIAEAGVCLGIFGTSAKADRVVPNKLYECLAVGRPVITGDTSGVRAAFGEGEVVTVPVGDPPALAAAVRDLLRDPRRREEVAAAGAAKFRAAYAEDVLARDLDACLRSVVGSYPDCGSGESGFEGVDDPVDG